MEELNARRMWDTMAQYSIHSGQVLIILPSFSTCKNKNQSFESVPQNFNYYDKYFIVDTISIELCP